MELLIWMVVTFIILMDTAKMPFSRLGQFVFICALCVFFTIVSNTMSEETLHLHKYDTLNFGFTLNLFVV